jgi:hypothetical protein
MVMDGFADFQAAISLSYFSVSRHDVSAKRAPVKNKKAIEQTRILKSILFSILRS